MNGETNIWPCSLCGADTEITSPSAAAIQVICDVCKPKRPPQEYLGDGVYVAPVHDGFLLYTSDGLTQTNKIVLDHETLAAMLGYFKRVKEAARG